MSAVEARELKANAAAVEGGRAAKSKKPVPKINQEKCIKCGVCAGKCPFNAIRKER